MDDSGPCSTGTWFAQHGAVAGSILPVSDELKTQDSEISPVRPPDVPEASVAGRRHSVPPGAHSPARVAGWCSTHSSFAQ